MKKLRYWQSTFLISVLAFSVFLTFTSNSSALNLHGNLKVDESNQSIPELEKGMYVIIGSFQILENAIKYTKVTTVNGKSPLVGKYQDSKFFYVYAYSTPDDLEYAREKRTELRATKEFYDAWLMYVGITLENLEQEEPPPDLVVIEQPKEEKPKEIIPPPPNMQDQDLFNFRFNVISATTFKEVPGYITIIDASRNKAMKSVSTNQTHLLATPNTQSKEIIVLCDIFGYVKGQVKLKIDDPMSSADKSSISESGGITTIKFELPRHKIGDVITMYNVYFYNNSAIMKPESKFELNSLLGMLKENEKLEIRIHGHTNGNAAGKIIKLKKGDTNFFQVTDNNDVSTGSAKQLSKARAEIIMNWLVDQGIDAKRMDLKGWGGKKMIYNKTDQMAGRNVRVEIELLKG